MNNFLFGDATRQYYETICGGTGAGPGFDGTSAMQTHMTNTRMTDPEVFELRYPVRLELFAIRRGSGGRGKWRGGDGAMRRVRFLEPMTAVIVSSRRNVAPFGLEGGADGAPACNGWNGRTGLRNSDRDRQGRNETGRRVRHRNARRWRLRARVTVRFVSPTTDTVRCATKARVEMPYPCHDRAAPGKARGPCHRG